MTVGRVPLAPPKKNSQQEKLIQEVIKKKVIALYNNSRMNIKPHFLLCRSIKSACNITLSFHIYNTFLY